MGLILTLQVRSSLCAFLSGEGSDIQPLIDVLKREPGLNGNCLRVIEDLILFAVETGNNTLVISVF